MTNITRALHKRRTTAITALITEVERVPAIGYEENSGYHTQNLENYQEALKMANNQGIPGIDSVNDVLGVILKIENAANVLKADNDRFQQNIEKASRVHPHLRLVYAA